VLKAAARITWCVFSRFFSEYDLSNMFVRGQEVELELEKKVAWCTPAQHSVGGPLSSF